MAKLILKTHGDVTFACYSERGIIAHLMYRVIPVRLDDVLNTMKFPRGAARPFNEVKPGELREITIFSELDFGTEGFGKPDGAVAFTLNDRRYMIFLEGKANEKYADSCKEKQPQERKEKLTLLEELAQALEGARAEEPSAPEGATSTEGYNSTLRGQLELRYRAIRLFKQYRDESVERREHKREMRDCLRETKRVKEFYRDKDGFYAHPTRTDEKNPGSWRRLWLKDGVKQVFEIIERTPDENILFLSFTTDPDNPLDVIETNPNAPRLFDDPNWRDAKHRFPWISSHAVENQWDHV
jgi:hypothetical protein